MSGTGVDTMFDAELALRERLTALVEAGKDGLDDFQSWFTQSFWDESALPEGAASLAHEVELIVAEYTSGHWTWHDVVHLLTQLLARGFSGASEVQVIKIGFAQPNVVIKSSAVEAHTEHVVVSA